MKTPNFWKNKNVISFLLFPFSIVYSFFRSLDVLFSSEYKTSLKVFCVGNLTAGGSGKTPLCIKIASIFKEKNINFAFLSKGYKGSIKEFTKVDLSKHSASETGDEPLLLAEFADTFICKNRKKAIQILSSDYNYDIIVMDDGFQNTSIHKNKNIIVVDGEYGIGNGELLPSGPLREKIKNALKRISFCVIIGEDKQNLEKFFLNNNIKVIKAFILEKNILDDFSKYIAFCGIGRSEKFFNSLQKANYNIVKKISFSDHHKYKEDDISKILLEAEKLNCRVITTKKDWVKLSEENKKKIEFLDIDIKFYNEEEFVELLLNE